MFKMVRLFLKNVFRSVFKSVLVYLIAGLITVVISVVWDLIAVDLLGLKFSLLTVPALMITCAVISLFVGGIMMTLASAYDSTAPHYPHIVSLFFMLLIIFLAFGGASAAFGFFGYDYIYKCCERSEAYILLVLAPPAAFMGQLCYFIGMFCLYRREDMCSKCKHVFCMAERSSMVDSYDDYGYTDRTRNEKIGSIGSAEIRADVTRRQYHRTRHTVSDVSYCCKRCGNHGSYKRHLSYKEKL